MPRFPLEQQITWDLLFRDLANEAAILADQASFNQNAAAAIRGSLHKPQQWLVDDPSRNKAALCPRRSGKSWAAMSYAHIVCLEKTNARVVICTLTLKSAKNIYWWEMQEFARHYGLTLDYYANELRVDFPNGSKIMLVGMESKQQIEKLRGGKYDLVIIDECKSFPGVVLSELIDEVIWPALGDRQGTLLMIGTPGSILDGPFYQATMPGLLDDAGVPYSRGYASPEAYWKQNPNALYRWSRHSWNRSDNKSLPHLWTEALEVKARNGWDDSHPTWIREYVGKWVASESAHVYAFARLLRTSPELVTWKPEGKGIFGLDPKHQWHFLLGLDLGFEDATALVIAAYNERDPVLYQVWDYKESHHDVDQVGELIRQALEMVPGGFEAIVGDFGGGGKQIIQTFNRRYGINIIAAEKRDKFDYIELLNTDYASGRIRLLAKGDLALEKQILQWDLGTKGKEVLAHTGKLREHPELPNHLCDAFLYIWRHSYHFFAERAAQGPEMGSREWALAESKRAIDFLLKQRADNAAHDFLDEFKGGPDVAQEYFQPWNWD